jgi:L-seryl-tRNA(Ser) seleniumtransferase
VKFSGAKPIEIGTTNRTNIDDYSSVINEKTGLIMKVHPSNFKIIGFTENVNIKALVAIGKEKGIPVFADLGSGLLIDFSKYGLKYGTTVQEAIKRDIDIITFSGDKLLGVPQAGIICVKKCYIDIPGHERFIKNMLAGIYGVDIVIVTIAADEGIMPQTKEHLEILKLLNVKKALIVLTKIELVDVNRITHMKKTVIEELKGTIFEKSPIITVSSKTV